MLGDILLLVVIKYQFTITQLKIVCRAFCCFIFIFHNFKKLNTCNVCDILLLVDIKYQFTIRIFDIDFSMK